MVCSKISGTGSSFTLSIKDLTVEKVGNALSALSLDHSSRIACEEAGTEDADAGELESECGQTIEQQKTDESKAAERAHTSLALRSLVSLMEREGVSRAKDLLVKVCPEVTRRRRGLDAGTTASEAHEQEGHEDSEKLVLTETNAAPLVLAVTRELLRPTARKGQANGGKTATDRFAVAA